ncbi:hypothetical protein [Aliarcobacter cryaerophilus]|uniref:hypothetical protein n=1 Tax=Aliarcobacter cryaerophilus TaxID=28198 RepID=UPI001654C11D|nr:hypothetical protein [Aliarcobacter cryaerophilus]QNM91534.1 hypothetical protein HOO33_06455 [Aliarcobacter cryaerophilus]
MKQEIEKIIIEVLQELNEELDNKNISPSSDTKLYGINGTLDSLGLVSFITDLEERISDKFNMNIVLADEKAMSQRTSPFRDVKSLTNYIITLIEEEK